MRDNVVQDILYYTLLCLKNDRSNHLPCESTMIDFITTAKKEIQKEDFAINLHGRWEIVGDLHGDIFSLVHIFSNTGYPPETKYLFLGDYVDRGNYSIEVMMVLMALKILYSDSIYLLRGNHETRSMTMSYGFYDECLKKMNEKIYEEFISFFKELPIVALINESVFCVHGGISQGTKNIIDIIELAKPEKEKDSKSKQIIHDLLWSDPCDYINFFDKSDRGGETYVFGEKALDEFLNENDFSCLIRAHQSCTDGYDKPFNNNKCYTVFSCADYCQTWNSAAVLIIEDDTVTDIFVFEPATEEEKKSEIAIFPPWLQQCDEASSQISIGFVDDLISNDYTIDLPENYASF